VGTACGYANNSAGWIYLGQTTVTITVTGNGNNTYVEMPTPVTIPAGQTYGLYIATFNGSSGVGAIRYTSGTSDCGSTTVATNSDLAIKGGHGITGPTTPFGGTINTERNFSGIIHYTVGSPGPFNVYRDGTQIGSSVMPSYTDSGFDPTVFHTWSVTAVCGNGESGEKYATLPACSYIINAAVVGGNGTISPSGAVQVHLGDNKIFYFYPSTCYLIDQVLVDGINNTTAVSNGYYTFYDIQDNHSIIVIFKPVEYLITATVTGGTGGTITPSGNTYVSCHDDATYIFTPASCYEIEQVWVDSSPNAGAVAN
jgi:hypothetical protein